MRMPRSFIIIGAERNGHAPAGIHIVVLVRIARHRRQHADDVMDLVVHRERRADDRRIAVELIHPELVAEHDDRRRADRLFAGTEGAPEQRLDADACRRNGRRRRRSARAADRHGRRAGTACCGIRRRRSSSCSSRLRSATSIIEYPSYSACADGASEMHEPVAAADRQPMEQHAVHHAEDRRARADADGERNHRGEREHRRLAQRAHGVARVLDQRLEQHPWRERRALLPSPAPHRPSREARRAAPPRVSFPA